jgi:hypothetical protein
VDQELHEAFDRWMGQREPDLWPRLAAMGTALLLLAGGALLLSLAFRPSSGPVPASGTVPASAPVHAREHITVATGTDPTTGTGWELWLAVTRDGLGTHLSNGGGGCCDHGPVVRPLQLDVWGGGIRGSAHIVAWVTDQVARAVYTTQAGTPYEGHVYPIPGTPDGMRGMALWLLPDGIDLKGTVTAYDAEGKTIDQQTLWDYPPSVSPAPRETSR